MAAPPQPTPAPPAPAAGANGDAAFRLGFVGAGNLAESIARGVAASGVLPASAIRTAPHRRPERGAAFADLGARILASNAQVSSNPTPHLLFVSYPLRIQNRHSKLVAFFFLLCGRSSTTAM
jgi:pyrroline-5-carboxylate reductase